MRGSFQTHDYFNLLRPETDHNCGGGRNRTFSFQSASLSSQLGRQSRAPSAISLPKGTDMVNHSRGELFLLSINTLSNRRHLIAHSAVQSLGLDNNE